MRPINLAIVDDHTLFRKTLKYYLAEQVNLNVVIQSPDMPDMLGKLNSQQVDVLVMDMFMPKLSGTDAVQAVTSNHPGLKILVLSMNSDLDIISNLLEFGIHGYVSKADEPDELLKAINAVADGRIYRNRFFTEALYWNKQHSIRTFGHYPSGDLNDREKKIIRLLWEEKSNKEIADELFLGIRSVEKIRQDLKEKLGVKSTVGLLKYAIGKKIITANPLSSDLIY